MCLTMIRQAKPTDQAVPFLMLQAMEDLVYMLIGRKDKEEAISFLNELFKSEENQYSYQNTFVAVDEENNVIGSITAYNGDILKELRNPVMKLLEDKYNRKIELGDETDGDELYLDTIAVAPGQQGKGIGGLLLRHIIAYAKEREFPKVGLLVDSKNPNAQRLYERTGFQLGKQKSFAGGVYYHMFFPLQ